MGDPLNMRELPDPAAIVALDDAIALIEDGAAPDNICVELAPDLMVHANGEKGMQGLLQRLRGHRMILALSEGEATESVVPMRSGKPDMHPDVAEILDALKDQG